jgi:hypothetical protein
MAPQQSVLHPAQPRVCLNYCITAPVFEPSKLPSKLHPQAFVTRPSLYAIFQSISLPDIESNATLLYIVFNVNLSICHLPSWT